MHPLARSGDTIEQSLCRSRTEEEQKAVDMSWIVRRLLNGGGEVITVQMDVKRDDFSGFLD